MPAVGARIADERAVEVLLGAVAGDSKVIALLDDLPNAGGGDGTDCHQRHCNRGGQSGPARHQRVNRPSGPIRRA